MTVFNTAFNHPIHYVQSPGSERRVVFGVKHGAHGSRTLYIKEEVDIQPEINSYLIDTQIGNILARVALGDTSMLRSESAVVYMDATQFQNMTICDIKKAEKQASDLFSVLPKALQEQYGTPEGFFDNCTPAALSRFMSDYSAEIIAKNQASKKEAIVSE